MDKKIERKIRKWQQNTILIPAVPDCLLAWHRPTKLNYRALYISYATIFFLLPLFLLLQQTEDEK